MHGLQGNTHAKLNFKSIFKRTSTALKRVFLAKLFKTKVFLIQTKALKHKSKALKNCLIIEGINSWIYFRTLFESTF